MLKWNVNAGADYNKQLFYSTADNNGDIDQ